MPVRDHDRSRDPQLVGLLPELARRLDEVPDYRPGDVGALRALMAEAMAGCGARPAEVVLVDGGGDHAVQIRVHRPEGRASGGALLHVHGGGFVMGSASLYDRVCRELAQVTGCSVLSVDYRLAPEHPFPAALDDCESAWTAVLHRAVQLDVDIDRVGVYGESAGGALAVGLVHRLCSSAQRPAVLVLQEPVTDDRLVEPSSRRFSRTPVWNRALATWSWGQYLSGAGTPPPPEAAPARLSDLAGFPPTFVSTRDLDPLRDEGLTFARRLIDEGVPVDLRHYAGTLHGTLGFLGAEVRERILRDAAEFVRDRLG